MPLKTKILLVIMRETNPKRALNNQGKMNVQSRGNGPVLYKRPIIRHSIT